MNCTWNVSLLVFCILKTCLFNRNTLSKILLYQMPTNNLKMNYLWILVTLSKTSSSSGSGSFVVTPFWSVESTFSLSFATGPPFSFSWSGCVMNLSVFVSFPFVSVDYEHKIMIPKVDNHKIFLFSRE